LCDHRLRWLSDWVFDLWLTTRSMARTWNGSRSATISNRDGLTQTLTTLAMTYEEAKEYYEMIAARVRGRRAMGLKDDPLDVFALKFATMMDEKEGLFVWFAVEYANEDKRQRGRT